MKLKQQQGQSLTETVILMPVLVLLIMGLIQLGQMYKAKATLNHATVQAARAGATKNGYIGPMRKALATALAPVEYKVRPGQDPGLLSFWAHQQLYKLNEFVRTKNSGGVDVKVLFPDADIFDAFRVHTRVLEKCRKGESCPYGGKFKESQPLWQIPNDNLNIYDDSLKNINGKQLNLQDANLLKIQANWCYPLKVPFANWLIHKTVKQFHSDGAYTHESWQACQRRRFLSRHDYWIPLTSKTVVRMQSPLRCEGDERNGNNCRNVK